MLPIQTLPYTIFFSSRRRHTRWPRDWSSDVCSSDLEKDIALKLVQRYGSNIDIVYQIFSDNINNAMKEHVDPIVLTELIYAMEYEAAFKPVDFFIRRTGALFLDISWVNQHKESVIRYMSTVLGWTDEQRLIFENELDQQIQYASLEVL